MTKITHFCPVLHVGPTTCYYS